MQTKRQKRRLFRLLNSQVTWLRTFLAALFGSFAGLLGGCAIVAGRVNYKTGPYWFEATPEKLPLVYWGWIMVLSVIALIFLGKSIKDLIFLIRMSRH